MLDVGLMFRIVVLYLLHNRLTIIMVQLERHEPR